jgi:hypothetical protein
MPPPKRISRTPQRPVDRTMPDPSHDSQVSAPRPKARNVDWDDVVKAIDEKRLTVKSVMDQLKEKGTSDERRKFIEHIAAPGRPGVFGTTGPSLLPPGLGPGVFGREGVSGLMKGIPGVAGAAKEVAKIGAQGAGFYALHKALGMAPIPPAARAGIEAGAGAITGVNVGRGIQGLLKRLGAYRAKKAAIPGVNLKPRPTEHPGARAKNPDKTIWTNEEAAKAGGEDLLRIPDRQLNPAQRAAKRTFEAAQEAAQETAQKLGAPGSPPTTPRKDALARMEKFDETLIHTEGEIKQNARDFALIEEDARRRGMQSAGGSPTGKGPPKGVQLKERPPAGEKVNMDWLRKLFRTDK